MDRQIRQIEKKDYEKAARIKAQSYMPQYSRAAAVEEYIESFQAASKMKRNLIFVYCEGDEVYGVFTFHVLEMNFYGRMLPVGALSGVAVDMARRREGIAAQMVYFFIEYCKKNALALAMLQPYNPAYYKKAGFGWGAVKYEYTLPLSWLKEGAFDRVAIDVAAPYEKMQEAHGRVAALTHGMCLFGELERYHFERDTAPEDMLIVYDKTGRPEGYALYQCEKDALYNPYEQTLEVDRLLAASPQATAQLLAFFAAQKSQFRSIRFNVFDESFYYHFNNLGQAEHRALANGYHAVGRTGMGLMYKVIDARALLAKMPADGLSNKYVFALRDEAGQVEKVEWGEGEIQIIRLRQGDFVSWAMGCISMTSLWHKGLAEADRNAVKRLDQECSFREKPVCTSIF